MRKNKPYKKVNEFMQAIKLKQLSIQNNDSAN